MYVVFNPENCLFFCFDLWKTAFRQFPVSTYIFVLATNSNSKHLESNRRCGFKPKCLQNLSFSYKKQKYFSSKIDMPEFSQNCCLEGVQTKHFQAIFFYQVMRFLDDLIES